ncbi:type II toxin-antitoxin system VapC family toxin [Methylobacterium sp. E-005]|uniref:type II toxin-antitoxin system VapC family toxin n=1 Tax=Methylobacterium sp. E-005 TaxID=2836549 RepID=UPI001FBC0AEB|nr:type II toxin-antitoxin system VapC family toxin [Methylobacterium sp. E-005]MCJ2084780.1 type II toxin-antitoxin system VapC family toxin [Methylobacterium sp. E-005]
MFIDASAIVAIVACEPGHRPLLDRLRDGPVRLTSGVAIYEAARAIARLKSVPPGVAEAIVDDFLDATGVTRVPIAAAEARHAIAAHARYGKGRHPARLNLGDCFAYACARVHGVPLLYIGDDFPQTDIPSALA